MPGLHPRGAGRQALTFRCDPAGLPAARAAGVGPTALLDSVAHTTSAGIAPVGVGADAGAEPAIVERGGWRIAVLGFGGVVPAAGWLAGPTRPGMANGDDIPTMTAAVRAAAARADLVLVAIHWGAELDTEPRREDVARARVRAMIDAGADAVFGHHSHRLQPHDDLPRPAHRQGAGQLRLAGAVRGRGRAPRSPGAWSSRTGWPCAAAWSRRGSPPTAAPS